MGTRRRTLADGRTVVAHDNGGLYKRCACPRRTWAKCAHPWHFGFQFRGREERVSLHKYANKPRGYVMSKADAEAIRDRLRGAIRDGAYPPPVETPAPVGRTFGDVADAYVKQYVRLATRRKDAQREMARQVTVWRRTPVPAAHGATVALEDKPADAVLKADVQTYVDARRQAVQDSRLALVALQAIEAEPVETADAEAVTAHAARVRAARPAARLAQATAKSGEVGINRMLTRLHHLFAWALDEGLVTRTPFTKDGTLTGRPAILRNSQAEGHRRRRLDGDEERRLIDAAGPHLRALIEAALETGCRKGELLTLTWGQVNLEHGVIMLPGEKTKTHEDRLIPVTARLKAILLMRRTGPDGKDLPAKAHVFGNGVGDEVKCIKTAWRLTCRRAGIADLHFHDLRREFGSRLLETPGTSLNEVQSWLGHATVTQTSAYLATTVSKLQAAARRFEFARTCRTNVAQNEKSGSEMPSEPPAELPANSLH